MIVWAMSRLARRSRAFVLGVSALSIGLLAIADHLAGPELRLFVFYWSAIAVTTWFGGRTWGLAFVALSGVAWIAANVPANESATWMRPWNAGVNLTSFGFLAYAVNVIGRSLPLSCQMARSEVKTPFQTVHAIFPHTAYRWSSRHRYAPPGYRMVPRRRYRPCPSNHLRVHCRACPAWRLRPRRLTISACSLCSTYRSTWMNLSAAFPVRK